MAAGALPMPALAAPQNTGQGAPLMPKLTGFVAGLRYDAIPPKTLEIAKTAIMDCLGVSVAGGREQSAQIMGKLALEEHAKEEATIYGQRFKSSALHAALVNGTSA